MTFECAADNIACVASQVSEQLSFGLAGNVLFWGCMVWVGFTFLKLFSEKGL